MKYIITENQRENLAMKFLNNTYSLEKFRTENHPNIIFFVRDGNAYMEWDIEQSKVYFSSKLNHAMKRSLENIFSLRLYDRDRVIDNWIEQYVSLDINGLYISEALPYPIKDL